MPPSRKSKRGAPTRAEMYGQMATGLGATAKAVEGSVTQYTQRELLKLWRALWMVLAIALFGIHIWLGTGYLVLVLARELYSYLRRRRGRRSTPASTSRGIADTSERGSEPA